MKTVQKSVFLAIFLMAALGCIWAQESEEPDPSLVAVGSLSASNLYLSYLVLGTVADGFMSESYDVETTRSIALETMFLNGNSRGALETLLNSEVIAPEEEAVVQDMIQGYLVLDNMAQALISFIDGKDDGSAYQVFRLEAWTRISKLLGLETSDSSR